jgi:hypothetical protein
MGQTQLKATIVTRNRRADSMPMSSVSGSIPQYRTAQAKSEGELRESITVKAKEAETQVL